MRLESFKRRWIGNGSSRLQTDCSSSFDSTDEDAKIRLDDPTLHLTIAESPSPSTDSAELKFNYSSTKSDSKSDASSNMNKCAPTV